MLDWLKKRRANNRTATEIYGAIVARARNPAFYQTCGVSDTPEGRYELIVLTMSMVLERLRRQSGPASELPRLVVEAFVTDMDDSMREMGVGDLTVPKKVKRAAAGLMERMEQYLSALADIDENELARALSANIPGVAATLGAAGRLAQCIRADTITLDGLSDADISAGRLSFSEVPDPRSGCQG